MAEQNNDSLYQKQKAVRPKPEDAAAEILEGDKLKNLSDFLVFLRNNKLTPRWASGNAWSVKYKSKTVCHIKIIGASWFIMFSSFTREKWFDGYDAYFTDDEIKQFVWENIKGAWCPRDCKGGRKTILGKECNDICTCWAIRAENPDGAALELSKRVIIAVTDFITDLAAASKT